MNISNAEWVILAFCIGGFLLIAGGIVFMPRANWKVIGTDNFCRDTVGDYLHTDCLTKRTAEKLATKLNEGVHDNDPTIFRAVPGDYQLYKWEP